MKNHLGLFSAVVMMASACLIMTSCDPDEIDAFAQGYRDGYYGYGSRAEVLDVDAGEAVSTDMNAE